LGEGFLYVGKSFPVDDAVAKVTGTLAYGGDVRWPGLLHVQLLLSTTAHGVVRRIDTARAEKLPGVAGVFTRFNTPETRFNRYGWGSLVPDETLFPSQVRFAGDRVAAVAATSLETARRAAALIEVEYEELPALLTPREALAPGAVAIHPGGNLIDEYDVELGTRPFLGDVLEVRSRTRTPMIHHAAIEPHVYLAACDDGKLTVFTPTQGIFLARSILADFFGLCENDVRVIKLPIGGSFGGKQEFIFEPLVAFLARATGSPVRLRLSREECMIAANARPAVDTVIRTTVTKDGVLGEFVADSTLDAGAYAGSAIDYAHALAKKVTRLYRIPYYRHTGRAVYTNKIVTGGARGWGSPEIVTAAEIHMDRVAAALGLDPVEFRLKNLVHPYDVDPAVNLSLGDARVRECLAEGARAFDWRKKHGEHPGSGRYRRGTGVACGAHKNGFVGASPDFTSTMLRMNGDGSLVLTATVHDVGCGVATTMRIIVAEVLAVDPNLVLVTRADTENTPFDFGCYGSRSTYVIGACALAAAQKLKERLLTLAAPLLEEPVERLTLRNGGVQAGVDGGKRISYRELARTVLNHADLLVAHTHHAVSNPGAYSVQFAGVEADTLTGLVRVTDFLAVGDIGRTINRATVEGQFQGAVQMGIGYALGEELLVDGRGRPANASFRKYHLVNAPDMPDVRVLLLEHAGDDGPFGAKSVGEIAAAPTAAAVVNAVNHALGTQLADLPLTPEKVLAALAALKKQ